MPSLPWSLGVFHKVSVPGFYQQDNPLNAGYCAFILFTMASIDIAPNRYRAKGDSQSEPYVFKDAVGGALRTTVAMGAIGLFFASVQNALTKQNVGAWGVVTKFGGTTTSFGMASKEYALGLQRG